MNNTIKKYIGILKGKGTLTTEKYLKTRKKEAKLKQKNTTKKYQGIFKGKIDLTSEEFIKERKEEAKLKERNNITDPFLKFFSSIKIRTKKDQNKLNNIINARKNFRPRENTFLKALDIKKQKNPDK